jgi:hypothetical protein
MKTKRKFKKKMSGSHRRNFLYRENPIALPGFGRTVRKGGIHEEVKMMCTETIKICAVIILNIISV